MISRNDVNPLFHSLIGMGEIQKVYKQNGISMFFEILLSLFMIGMGLLAFSYDWFLYQTGHSINMEMILIFLCGPFFMWIGIYSLKKEFLRWNDMAVTYQNGLGYFQGNEPLSFLWTEITSIRAIATDVRVLGFIPAGVVRDYWIATASTELRLASTLDQVDDLLAEIRKGTFPHIFEKMKQKVDTAKSVDFGSITIDKSGVQMADINYPWLDVAQAGLANGMVHYIPEKGRSSSRGIHAPTQHVPNFDVLLALSNDLMKEARMNSPRNSP